MHTGDTLLNCGQSWGTLQARLQLSICPREATALIAFEKALTKVCIIFNRDPTLKIDTNLGFTKDIYLIVRTKLGVPGAAHN